MRLSACGGVDATTSTSRVSLLYRADSIDDGIGKSPAGPQLWATVL